MKVRPSHVTLTVALVRLFVLRCSPQLLKKREAASCLDIRYIPSQSSADQQSYRKRFMQEECVFKYRKTELSNIFPHVDLFSR